MRKEDQWNKQGHHEIIGDGSCEISSYKLPETDVCHERRNFPGYQTYAPSTDLMNEISCEGTTDTQGGKSMKHARRDESGELKRSFK